MKQYCCYECGIPVKDLEDRTPRANEVFICEACCHQNHSVYSEALASRNGVFHTSEQYGTRHYPRWNYPTVRSATIT